MPDNERGIWEALAFASYVSSYVLVTVGGTIAGGYFLDRYLGTSPWLTIIGLLVGLASAFYGVFKFVTRNGR